MLQNNNLKFKDFKFDEKQQQQREKFNWNFRNQLIEYLINLNKSNGNDAESILLSSNDETTPTTTSTIEIIKYLNYNSKIDPIDDLYFIEKLGLDFLKFLLKSINSIIQKTATNKDTDKDSNVNNKNILTLISLLVEILFNYSLNSYLQSEHLKDNKQHILPLFEFVYKILNDLDEEKLKVDNGNHLKRFVKSGFDLIFSYFELDQEYYDDEWLNTNKISNVKNKFQELSAGVDEEYFESCLDKSKYYSINKKYLLQEQNKLNETSQPSTSTSASNPPTSSSDLDTLNQNKMILSKKYDECVNLLLEFKSEPTKILNKQIVINSIRFIKFYSENFNFLKRTDYISLLFDLLKFEYEKNLQNKNEKSRDHHHHIEMLTNIIKILTFFKFRNFVNEIKNRNEPVRILFGVVVDLCIKQIDKTDKNGIIKELLRPVMHLLFYLGRTCISNELEWHKIDAIEKLIEILECKTLFNIDYCFKSSIVLLQLLTDYKDAANIDKYYFTIKKSGGAKEKYDLIENKKTIKYSETNKSTTTEYISEEISRDVNTTNEKNKFTPIPADYQKNYQPNNNNEPIKNSKTASSAKDASASNQQQLMMIQNPLEFFKSATRDKKQEINVFFFINLATYQPELVLESIAFYDAFSFIFDTVHSNLDYDDLSTDDRFIFIEFTISFIRFCLDKIKLILTYIKFDACLLEKAFYVKIYGFLIEILNKLNDLTSKSVKFVKDFQKNPNGIEKIFKFLINPHIFSLLLNDDDKVNSLYHKNVSTNIFSSILTKLFYSLFDFLVKLYTYNNYSPIEFNSEKLLVKLFKIEPHMNKMTSMKLIELVLSQYDYNKTPESSDNVLINLPLSLSEKNVVNETTGQLNEYGKIFIEYFGSFYINNLKEPNVNLENQILNKLFIYLNDQNIFLALFKQNQIELANLIYENINFLHNINNELQNVDNLLLENETFSLKQQLSFMKKLYFFLKFFSLLKTFSYVSLEFCSLYHESNKDGIKLLFDIIQNGIFSKYLLKLNKDNDNNDFKQQRIILNLCCTCLKNCLFSIENLSKMAYKFKTKWQKLNAVEALLQVANAYGRFDKDFQYIAYITISNLADENDIKNLKQIKDLVSDICKLVEPFCDLLVLGNQENIVRYKIQYAGEDNMLERVSVIYYGGWHLLELLNALFNFSKSDQIKYFIYHDLKLDGMLRKIIYYGNEIEQEYALKLLYQLSFDENIAKDIQKDGPLVNVIKNPISKKERFKKFCEGVLWVIDKGKSSSGSGASGGSGAAAGGAGQPILAPKQKPIEDQHIMISYNRESRDICLRIRSELQKLNFKTWIDVDDIRGSTLDAMADAIENSSCVLICMTEKYKESPNCRFEAEYVIQKQRPYIPLIMQKSYKPDGWLGLILGSKMFIDYTKYEFEECMSRLIKEINNIYQMNKEMTKKNRQSELGSVHLDDDESNPNGSSRMRDIVGNRLDVKNLKQEDIDKWLKEKNFHHLITNNLIDCDGQMFEQIYKIYLKAPEFFIKNLCSKQYETPKLTDLAKFLDEFEKFFESQENPKK